jgi:pimeloyl-ACP methyl ester carboxylesterase
MRIRRAAVAGLAVLGLVTGCGSAGASHGSSPASAASAPAGQGGSSDAATPTASPLQPLPAAIPDNLRPYYSQQLAWTGCDSGFQCTTFKVPLDYANPSAGDITLSAVRRPAVARGGSRLGSLLVNPGGPGGSAIQYAEYAALSYPLAVRDAYDIVGLDPRGVGRSSPVTCLSDAQMDAFTQVENGVPSGAASIAALEQMDKQFAQACAARSGQLLGHVSTVEAARDMDVLRALLGDARLNYLGKSYGTFLGATYAGLFPSRVGRMVLDGVLDPSLDAVTLDREQAGGFEVAFDAFAADCVKRAGCPLGTTTAAAGQKLSQLFGSWQSHPLPTGQSRNLDQALGMTGVIAAMYDQEQWPQLRTALSRAEQGDGSALLALSDQYYERDPHGSYTNLMAANTAVDCLDDPAPATTAQQVEQQLPAFEKASPHFGASLAWAGLSCAYWPVKATGRPHTTPAVGAPPIVVVGTTRDPATPYAWARSLAGQLSSGRLLTYDGDGHTAYSRGSDCIDTAVDRYLLAGTVPAAGTVCH